MSCERRETIEIRARVVVRISAADLVEGTVLIAVGRPAKRARPRS